MKHLPVFLVLLLLGAFTLQQRPAPAHADNGITLLSSSSFTDEVGVLHVVGEVRNDTGQSTEFVDVIATFTDASGAFLATQDTFTTLDTMTPAAVSPFDLLLDSPPAGIASYSLQMQWDPASDTPVSGLTLLNDRLSHDSVGYSHIAGQVRNDSGGPVQFVEIIATFYGADGTVVDTDFTFSRLETMQPGQVSPYELIAQPPVPFTRYALIVQGDRP